MKNASALLSYIKLTFIAVVGTLLPMNLATAQSKELIDAAAIYHNYCSVCHGDKGDGRSRAQGSLNPPPKDFTTSKAATELTLPRMIDAITNGVANTAMTPWKHQLNDAEIAAVANLIRERFMPATLLDTHNPGRRIFAENCSVCHGDRGEGAVWTRRNLNPPPRNFSLPSARDELTPERMIFSVTHGRPQTAMPAFGSQLSTAEIDQVVSYIRAAFMGGLYDTAQFSGTDAHKKGGITAEGQTTQTVTSSQNSDPKRHMALPLQNEMVGDYRSGMALYNFNCVPCHGVSGDAHGPRAYFVFPKPRDFTHPASRNSLNRPTLFDAIAKGRRGSEMPAWEKVLTDQEIANISEYVYKKFIQTE